MTGALLNAVAWLGRLGLFCVAVLRALLFRRPPIHRALEEAYSIGVQSLPVLLIISVFVGSILVLQGYTTFSALGAQNMVGMFVALAGVRELAPIVAATMIAAKAGTEMASQIAVMRTREQIDALEVMAVDPYWFLIAPRLLGILLVMPALTAIAVFTTVLSGLVIAAGQLHLNGAEFLVLVRTATTGVDLLVAMTKAMAFGTVIVLMSTFCGFTAQRGPEGVGQATNTAVVISAVVCVTVNFLISQAVYG